MSESATPNGEATKSGGERSQGVAEYLETKHIFVNLAL
jgi:hypothetical protein